MFLHILISNVRNVIVSRVCDFLAYLQNRKYDLRPKIARKSFPTISMTRTAMTYTRYVIEEGREIIVKTTSSPVAVGGDTIRTEKRRGPIRSHANIREKLARNDNRYLFVMRVRCSLQKYSYLFSYISMPVISSYV